MDILLLTETNFILDIAFEQAEQCERLLVFARKHNVPILLPEFCFAEAEGNITNTLRKRSAAIDVTISALKQSGRSAYHDVEALISQLEEFNVRAEKNERPTLHSKLTDIERIVGIIPFTAEIAARAHLRSLRQIAPFKPSDQHIYESILHFLKENLLTDTTILFLTRDRHDFGHVYIHEELSALSVELFFSAGECLKRMRSIVRGNA